MYFENDKINLNYLKFFIVAAESKSISEVAEKLDYSSSNVSINISALENQLGVRLLDRDPLRTTEIGQQIYEIVKKAYSDIEFASILAKIAMVGEFKQVLLASLISAIIAALTIFGKASLKKYAIKHANGITLKFAKFLNFFTKKG